MVTEKILAAAKGGFTVVWNTQIAAIELSFTVKSYLSEAK